MCATSTEFDADRSTAEQNNECDDFGCTVNDSKLLQVLLIET